MRSNFGARYLGAGLWIDEHASGAVYADPNIGEVPDLTDPATLGCIMALVRERFGPLAHLVRFATNAQPNGPGTDLVPAVWWALSQTNDDKPLLFDFGERWRFLAAPTEAETLVYALEARHE